MLSDAQTTSHDLLQRLTKRLARTATAELDMAALYPHWSVEQRQAFRQLLPTVPTPAAVLVPLVPRPEGLTVLFTERAAHLRHHAGQISFPGGRIESGDADPRQAALRESQEEIGLSPAHVQTLGYLPPHWVITGFAVHPVVGLIQPGFTLNVDHNEVAEVFEVPLSQVLDVRCHVPRVRSVGELSLPMVDIVYGEHRIWGATANILMTLSRLLGAG